MVISNVGGGKAVRNIQTGWILDSKEQESKVGSVHITVKPNGDHGDYISYKTRDSSNGTPYGVSFTHTDDNIFYYKVPIRGFKNINKIVIQIDAPAVSQLIDIFEFNGFNIKDDVKYAIVNYNYYDYVGIYNRLSNSIDFKRYKEHYYISDDLSALVFCLPFSINRDSYTPPFEINVKKNKKDLLVRNDKEIYYDMYTDFKNSYPFHYTIIEYY